MEKVVGQSRKKDYITILSVLASFAVVALHVNSFWSFRESKSWVFANAVECLFYFAVPVFFMITGATLIDYRKRYTTKQFIMKRVKRTVIPFLVWSLLGAIVYLLTRGEWIGIRGFISGILNCNFVDIYWFFPALFAVYLIIPLVSLIPEDKRRIGFGYAIIVGLVLNSILPFLAMILKIEYSDSFVFPLVGYVVYALIGYWVSNYPISPKYRRAIYVSGILGISVHFIGTWIASYQIHQISMMFKGYLSIFCVMFSAAIFVWFRYLSHKKLLKVLSKISKPFTGLTYGIYLVQYFVLLFVRQIEWINQLSVWFTIVGCFVVYALCAGITFLISKIPILKEII